MKFVIYYYRNNNEFERVMEIIKNVGVVVDKSNITPDDIKNDNDTIYMEYRNIIYKFNRYDPIFIEKVEESIRTNPYSHFPGINYEGHLIIFKIDARFTNKKYYTITKHSRFEDIVIHTDLIIDDLYYNRYEP